MFKKLLHVVLLTACVHAYVNAETIVEVKAAGFIPTDSCFKDIYGSAGGIYGIEATTRLFCSNFFGFLSVDFFPKRGCSIGLNSDTRILVIPVGIGLKYFVPYCFGNLYVGLGFQPTGLRIKDCFQNCERRSTKWGMGGVAKFGSYIDLCYGFVLDLFVNYSFVKTGCHNRNFGFNENILPRKANIHGVTIGAGLGYCF